MSAAVQRVSYPRRMGICEFIKWKFKCPTFELMLRLALNGATTGSISCGNKVLRSF